MPSANRRNYPKKIFLGLSLFLALSLIALLLSLPYLLDLNRHRDFISERLSKGIGEPVSLGDMHLDVSLDRGANFYLDNATISSGTPGALGLDNLLLDLKLRPLLNKQLIINRVILQSPEILAQRDAEGNLYYPFQEMLKKPKKPPTFKQVTVNQIIISRGRIAFTDKSKDKPYTISARRVSLKGSLENTVQGTAQKSVFNINPLSATEVSHPNIPLVLKNILLRASYNSDKESPFDLRAREGTYKEISFDRMHAQGNWRGTVLKLNKFTVHSANGTLITNGIFSFFKDTGPGYQLIFSAQNIDSERIIDGLSEKEAIVTGNMNLSGKLSSSGKSTNPLNTISGQVKLQIADGTIRKFKILASIFALTNPIYLIKGLPDIEKEGFPFDHITGELNIKDGLIDTQNFILDSPSWKIVTMGQIDLFRKRVDLKVYILPLRATATLISKVPVLRRILLGKEGGLLTTYFEVRGEFKSIEVTAHPISSLTKTTWGIVSRTLSLPLDLLKMLPLPASLKD